jgi:hypothetical protein
MLTADEAALVEYDMEKAPLALSKGKCSSCRTRAPLRRLCLKRARYGSVCGSFLPRLAVAGARQAFLRACYHLLITKTAACTIARRRGQTNGRGGAHVRAPKKVHHSRCLSERACALPNRCRPRQKCHKCTLRFSFKGVGASTGRGVGLPCNKNHTQLRARTVLQAADDVGRAYDMEKAAGLKRGAGDLHVVSAQAALRRLCVKRARYGESECARTTPAFRP